jgi:NADH-quinone oxidoreductase subunit G
MADNIILTIDGISAEVPPGTLIVEAARQVGREIPTFCYDPRLRSVGACRMCLVEVEKMPKLVASCATPVAPNMVVHTASERVVKARKGVIEFLLINHPLDCPTCDKGGECPLQDLTYDYGPTASRYRENKIRFIDDINQKFDDLPLGPEIVLNRNRCIMCYKCVRIVRELAGEADLGVFNRGALANINTLKEVAFADEFSGNTVEYCPVGALLSRSFKYKVRDWLLKRSPSICSLCSVGCNMFVEWNLGKVYRHMSRRNKEVDNGWLCDRGRYAFDIAGANDRLLKPHIRRGASLEPCAHDEAVIVISKHLRRIIDENRGTEVAAVGSAMLSNEEAFAIRSFFEGVVRTTDIDFQTDTNQPLKAGILDHIGLEGTIKDLEKDSLFLFLGCDPAVEQPVAVLKIKRAISGRNAKAFFLGPYDKRLGYFPVTNLRIPFGSEPFAIESIAAWLEGSATKISPTGADDKGLYELAGLLKIGGAHIISGRGFFSHSDRNGFLTALLRLRRITGAKLSILPTQGNFIGVSHFGLFGDTDHSFEKILERIDSGEVKTLFIFGANPVDEYPDRKYVHEILKKLEFLVVTAPFMHPTASLAGVVLPQALVPDYGGTLVNIEGRIQQFYPMAETPDPNIRPVWGILGDLADLLRLGNVWYSDREVRQEIAGALKGLDSLAKIPPEGFVVPFLNHADNETVDTPPRPLEKAGADLPYLLQWTPSVHHNGWLTERSENLMRISGRQSVLIHPADASRDAINDGDLVRLGNDQFYLELDATITEHVNQGEVLVINSFSGNPVNKIMRRDSLTTFVSVKRA